MNKFLNLKLPIYLIIYEPIAYLFWLGTELKLLKRGMTFAVLVGVSGVFTCKVFVFCIIKY